MNSIHDMGGMDGFGPVLPEADEPVFHAEWEGRVFAMVRATGLLGRWTLDGSRLSLERLNPVDYLKASYYERWLQGLETRLVATGLVTAAELARPSGRGGGSEAPPPVVTVAAVSGSLGRRDAGRRADAVAAKFKPGDAVVARVMNPTGHTRIPRYVRGRRGVIDRDHGVFVFPDTNAELAGEKPQHVYAVRFTASEIWGADAAERDSVYVDLWDDYLDPV
ncbi:MAG: nthB [Rhodospirillales bacterium]|jgi:nitrile hydratase beta subunit|nr:nthB [Rhodospirillales bacterium]